MPALSRKIIALMCLATAAIFGVLMLAACGKDVEPAETHEATAATATEQSAPAAPAEPAAPDVQKPEKPEPLDSYNVTCYSGSTVIFRVKTINDHLNLDTKGDWEFTNLPPDDHVAYVNGVCVVEQE